MLSNTQQGPGGFLALGGFGLGLGPGLEDVGFGMGMGRGGWAFPGVVADGGSIGGGVAGSGVGHTWGEGEWGYGSGVRGGGTQRQTRGQSSRRGGRRDNREENGHNDIITERDAINREHDAMKVMAVRRESGEGVAAERLEVGWSMNSIRDLLIEEGLCK
ncbi:hypothetical protein Ahy_B02g057650 [Arachis hypogaea]|uniref:Uncharacterized protein n=1 Tax=Arachis hypogaea TaxID=3818 RepID=A0A445ACS1_ARAHY|nr:hypothetical protein Ahy_B02g057650 [Arachis hypogaea]